VTPANQASTPDESLRLAGVELGEAASRKLFRALAELPARTRVHKSVTARP
jgi:hypothetical protein